jgi:hypothetical protein
MSLKRPFPLPALWLVAVMAHCVAAQPYELSFSTYLGGSAGEVIRDVEVDSRGCVYVAGTTRSADFPTTHGAYDTTFDTSAGSTR